MDTNEFDDPFEGMTDNLRLEFEKLPEGLRRAHEGLARVFVKRKLGTESPKLSEAGYKRDLRLALMRVVKLAKLHDLSVEAAEDARPREFPIDALGPTLAGVTRAIIEIAQCQPSLAAATVLGHVAGAVQAIADVRTPQGTLLTSGAAMIIVESSDGKGVAWKIAIAPFEKYEEELRKDHKKHMRQHTAAMAVWLDEQERIRKTPVLAADLEAKVAQLADHEERKPRRPNDPKILFTGGGTAEGIIKEMGRRPPSVIHSVTDAAQFLRGAGFGEKNGVATGSQLIDLVDSGRAERTIKGERNEPNIRIDDRRLSQHMMIQPDVALPFMKNADLRRLGYHARYLKTAEPSIAVYRVVNSLSAIDISADERKLAYDEVMLAMLRAARFKANADGDVPHALNAWAVDPIELRLSPAAARLSDAFVNKITPRTALGMRYGGEVREAARKIGEHAIKLAGRLHIVEAFTRPWQNGAPLIPYEIQPDVMERAILIAHWFLDEDRRYILSLTQAPESDHERLVLDWLRRTVENPDAKWKPTPAQPDGWYMTKDDRKRGPNEMRSGTTRERDELWLSMFAAMASAEPPRAIFVGDPRARGGKVRIPRDAVYG
jgi:Protein of unknown function (DUF3987)